MLDCLLKDSRVGSKARHSQLADVARERAVGEHGTGDVVEPEALAELM